MEEGGYEQGYQGYGSDFLIKIRDLEEKQRFLKNRLVLLGENLLEIKQDTNEKLLEIKKDMDIIKTNMERMISFLETASSEFSKFAKKEDLDILAKQARMFQPIAELKKEKNK
ncbi:hypothetical protein K9L16_00425 [Candidatus Pacearchaeota archaeon]|nr:hypothetical protein [Candidatus Pacearchaeota archaeon]